MMKKFFIYLMLSTIISCANGKRLSTDPFLIQLNNLKNELLQVCETSNASIVTIQAPQFYFSCSGPNANTSSQFYTGSLGKQMTSFMFLTSLEQKFSINAEDLISLLNQPLTQLFPNSLFLHQISSAWPGIVTSLNLLTHTSGIQDYVEVFEENDPLKFNSPIGAIKIVNSVQFFPNEIGAYHYSNTNYFVLGQLIQELTNQPLNQYFNTIIRDPSKMFSSQMPIIGNFFALKAQPQFARLVPDLDKEIFIDMSNAVGAGSVISTSSDLLLWNRFFYSIQNTSLRQIMLKTYLLDVDGDAANLGLSTSLTQFGPLVGWQGAIDSYRSFLARLIDHNADFVILSNNSDDFEKILDVLVNFFNSPDNTYSIETYVNSKTKYENKTRLWN